MAPPRGPRREKPVYVWTAVNALVAFAACRWVIGGTLAFGLWAAALFAATSYMGTKARLRGPSLGARRQPLRLIRGERDEPDQDPAA